MVANLFWGWVCHIKSLSFAFMHTGHCQQFVPYIQDIFQFIDTVFVCVLQHRPKVYKITVAHNTTEIHIIKFDGIEHKAQRLFAYFGRIFVIRLFLRDSWHLYKPIILRLPRLLVLPLVFRLVLRLRPWRLLLRRLFLRLFWPILLLYL